MLSADATVDQELRAISINTGTIAGRSMVSHQRRERQQPGRAHQPAAASALNARNDIHNIGGSITADNAAVLTAGGDINIRTTTQSMGGAVQGANIDRIAGVYVSNPGGALIASAGRDVNLIGAALVSAGSASVGAGRNINLDTVTEASGASAFGQGIAGIVSQSREIGSVIQAKDNVNLAAGNDLNIRAGAVASTEGALVATARNDINLTAGQATSSIATATVSSSSSLLKKSSSSTFDSSSITSVVSSSLSGNTVALVAGNDINAQAAQLRSDEAMSLSAGRDISFTTATHTTQEAHARQSKTGATGLGSAIGTSLAASGLPGGMFAGAALTGGRSANGAEASTRHDAIGTSVSAGSLQMVSGRDTTLQAATVVTDGDIAMIAGRNLTIESAQNTSVGSSYSADGKSGMIGTWYNPSVGHVKSSEAVATTRTTQASSQVASLQGNVTLVAGGTYTQTASSVMAAGLAGPLVGGDVNILAKNVVINEAYNTEQSVSLTHQSSTVMGGSASVGGLSTDSIKGASSTIKAMGETSDARMQALGAVNLAMSGKQAYDSAQALASGGSLGYKVSVNLSRNESQGTRVTDSSQAVGSSVVGANNVNIVATGGGQDSNIHAVGSTIAAGNTVNLAADNHITLQASKNTSVTVGNNSSSGASVGVGFAAGAQNGFTIDLGVNRGKGNDNHSDTTYNNTHVSGGKAVNVSAGGDLTLRGAVIDANRVTANVGGNLSVESLQDVSVGQSRQSSSGLNVSLCIPPICYGVSTVGGSAASAKANGTFVSVGEQSGIKAGDGGFDVKVRGNTDLKGAVIESTQAAIDAGKNSFTTGGTLTLSDLQNVSQSSGSSYAVSGSVGTGLGDQAGATSAADKQAAASAGANSTPGGSAGVGSDSGSSQTSVTKSGISGIAGDESVRTGDNASAGTLVKDWSTQTIVRDVQAQAQITQQFNQNAAKAIGDYAGKKEREALARSDVAEAAKWAEGGEYRVALHTAAGALSGGVAGAIGAGASAAVMPRVGEAIAEMGLATPVAQALGAVTAAAIGATAGGAAGAASAYSVDINNRQLHPTERDRIKQLAGGDSVKEARLTAAACSMVRCADGVPPSDPTYGYLRGLQDSGAAMTSEIALLSNQPGNQAHADAMLFRYSPVDAAADWASRDAIGTRIVGAMQGTAGTIGVAGSAAICTTILGCVAGAVGATVSADLAQAGIRQAATGQAQTPYGEQVLQSLGMSPQASALTYAVLGLAPAVGQSFVISRAVDAEAAANAWARGTYNGTSAVAYDGPAYRYSLPDRSATTWEITKYNVASDHRYSSVGNGAVYAGTAPATAAAEVQSYGPLGGVTLYSREVVVNNVLDLTNPAARQALGVTLEDLTQSMHGGASYEATQRISAWARQQGYNAILAPSAQTSIGANLISFRALEPAHLTGAR